MKNALFDDESLEILLEPRAWRIVGSLLPREVEPVSNPRHRAWMAAHVDRHPAREVLIALKGRGVYGFRGEVYPCVPGTVFLFESYEPHDDYYAPGCPRMRHLWLYILENDLIARILDVEGGRILSASNPSVILSGTGAAALLIAAWNELAAASHHPALFRRAKTVAALNVLIARLVEEGYATRPKPAASDFAATVIATIRRHVERQAGRGVPLAEAARLAGYSKFHFLRLFKRHTGQTYHAYVDACRLTKARAMLDEGRRKKEIAEALGFSHASALLRWRRVALRRAMERTLVR